MAMTDTEDSKNVGKVALVSLGCDKNLMDSEVMLGIITEKGYSLTPNKDEAEILILNTCGFIKDAVSESFENATELAERRKNGICKALILTGCMAQRYKEDIFDEIPEVDAVLGTGDYEEILNVIEKALGGGKTLAVSDINNDISEESRLKRVVSTPNHYAYIKIAEGCDNHCTYCTIPSLRGRYRSRQMESLIKEAESLAKQGIKELVVVAQDTSLYGQDIYGEAKIDKLLHSFTEIEGIEWVRLLYCYPEHITQGLINEMARNPKICNYIDMPIQHACDNILKLMGRKSSRAKIELVIKELREKIPDIALRTTLIAGFPGEAKEDFDEMVSFIKSMQFDRLGVFTYSKEDGTPAAKMKNQVPGKEKIRRREKLMQEQQRISEKKNGREIGKTYKVLVEGVLPDDENVYYGRTYMDCPEADGLVFFSCDKKVSAGEFVNVRINEASEYDLVGELSK